MEIKHIPLLDCGEVQDFFLDENGLIRFELKSGKWILINGRGEIAGGHSWDCVYASTEGIIRVMRGMKMGMVDAGGEIVVPPVWDAIEPVYGGCAVVRLNGKFGAVDASGRVVAAPEWDEMGRCSEGCMVAKRDGEYFILHTDGSDPTPVHWECRHVEPFANGLALYMDDENCKYGLIDLSGRIVTPPDWDSASRSSINGSRIVQMDGKFHLAKLCEE